MKSRTRSLSATWQATSLSLLGPLLAAFCQGLYAQERFVPRETGPPKVMRYVAEILARHDHNGDGRLEPAEWQGMQGSPQTIDRNHDGEIVTSELSAHVMAYARARMPVSHDAASEEASSTQDYLPPPLVRPQEGAASAQTGAISVDGAAKASGESTGDKPAASGEASAPRTTKFVVRPSRATHNLPEWFLSLDTDGDRQLTLREFGPDSAGRSREFEHLDHNGDGLLTPQEMTATPSPER